MGMIRLDGPNQTPASMARLQCYAQIAAANGAGDRAITSIVVAGIAASATASIPSGRAILKVVDSITGADYTADYASATNAVDQVHQIGGNHAGDSPWAIFFLEVNGET